MIGSEYNWLVSFTRTANGAPKVVLTRTGLFTLVVAIFCFFCIALHAGSGPVAGAHIVATEGRDPGLVSVPQRYFSQGVVVVQDH